MENNDSVCFVAKIDEIKEIPGADNIEQAIVGGWSCIIKKGYYKVDEMIVVATTDAVIPQDLSDKMEVTNYLRKGQRVRTVKLRGVYSECLLIPTKYIPGYGDMYHEGMDMMERMSIFKYEPPIKTIQLSSGRKIRYQDNPNFHVYYKFPNLKNVSGMFTEQDDVQITRKIHGTNARYGIVKKIKLSFWDKIRKALGNKWIEYEFVVGSHNVEKGSDSQGFYDTNVWYEIADKYDLKDKLWKYIKDERLCMFPGNGVTLYGEIYGAGIQSNYDYGLKDIRFKAFDISENGQYQDTLSARITIVHILDLPHVDILHEGKWSQQKQDALVFNKFISGTKIPEEGIVIKHTSGQRNKIAKVINPDYLIYAEKKDVGDSH